MSKTKAKPEKARPQKQPAPPSDDKADVTETVSRFRAQLRSHIRDLNEDLRDAYAEIGAVERKHRRLQYHRMQLEMRRARLEQMLAVCGEAQSRALACDIGRRREAPGET